MTISRGRACLGVLVPCTNTSLEPDMALLRPDGVSLHFDRLGGYNQDEIPDSEQIKHDIGAQAVTTAGAQVHALQTLKIRRIGFASPYVPAFNDMAVACLAETGVETVSSSDVNGTLDNRGKGALPPDPVYKLGRAADHPETEAVVLSCTDLRSVEIIAKREAKPGNSVIMSNQQMVRQAMQLAGLEEAFTGFGRLPEGKAA